MRENRQDLVSITHGQQRKREMKVGSQAPAKCEWIRFWVIIKIGNTEGKKTKLSSKQA